MNNIEIERKFLIDKFPETLPCIKYGILYQSYYSVDPEVRIRKHVYANETQYFLTFKGNGDLSRKEIELSLTADQFLSIESMIKYPPIRKEVKIYQLPNGLTLECCKVDEGSNTEFMYAEVEFPTEEYARTFQMIPEMKDEITYDKAYKMKNYWKRTRLGG